MSSEVVARTLLITSDECPQLPLRVLGLLAQRGLLAEHFECRRVSGGLVISVVLPRLPSQTAEILEQKVRAIVGVITANSELLR